MYSICILSSILFNSIFFLALHFPNVVFLHICWWFTNASHVRCFVSVQNNTKCLPFDTIFTYSSICFAMSLYYFHICIRVMMINWAYIYNWKHTKGMTYMKKKKTQQNINKPRKNLGQFCMRAYCLKWWFFYRIEFENGKSDRYILTTFHCSQMKSDYSTGSRFHCNNCCECNNCNRSHCMKVLFIPTFMHIIIQCM